MRKHIFGLAIFGFIFSLTAAGFAYFYAPQIGEITQPSEKNAKPASCFPRLKKDISYRVESIRYDLDSKSIFSKVRIKWQGKGDAPDRILSAVNLFTVENGVRKLSDEKLTLANPFENGNETEITIEYKLQDDSEIDASENLYALINFSEDERFLYYIEDYKDISRASQVLFVHGESSIIQK